MASSEPPAVATDSLTKEFGRVTALSSLDLAVEGPSIVGVAGPNGSGKTTLVRCLLGLLEPTAGVARIDGTDSRSLSADGRRQVGYMPQADAIYADLTVRENVAFFADLYGVDDAAAVEEVLAFVDLADRADDRIGALSGGMVRRTSLACALVHDPAVVFLDEPTVGLDPELRARMWDGFQARRRQGRVVLVTTHYLAEVARCDRALFLREGRVLADDAPDALLAATGTDDMEAAFLALLERDDGADPAAAQSGRAER